MVIEAYGLILQLGFVNNLGSRRARRAGSLLIALGVIGTIASVIWWQNFYSQMIGRAPIECLYKLGGSCRTISDVAGFFGAAAYDGRLFWASSIVFIVGLFFAAVTVRWFAASFSAGCGFEDRRGVRATMSAFGGKADIGRTHFNVRRCTAI